MKRPAVYREELVRNEMFIHLGYYVTESSGHNSEYSWWFRKRPDLIRKYCLKSTGWNPGAHAYILNEYRKADRTWKKEIRKWFDKGAPMPRKRGNEYAAAIINALRGGAPFQFNGNVPNKGIIPNLPPGVCVEVPVLTTSRGFKALPVGELPMHLAAINHVSVSGEEMAVEAVLTGDPELVYRAVCIDPLTASVLSLAEIRKMVQAMLLKNRKYLPQFKNIRI